MSIFWRFLTIKQPVNYNNAKINYTIRINNQKKSYPISADFAADLNFCLDVSSSGQITSVRKICTSNFCLTYVVDKTIARHAIRLRYKDVPTTTRTNSGVRYGSLLEFYVQVLRFGSWHKVSREFFKKIEKIHHEHISQFPN
jgi:hypothetical protein